MAKELQEALKKEYQCHSSELVSGKPNNVRGVIIWDLKLMDLTS